MYDVRCVGEETRSCIAYIIGRIDGLVDAGCSMDAAEIKEFLMPIRETLKSIADKGGTAK